MIDISIIVPVYNVCKYVAECLNSLVNQTFENYEIIIINDGSTDDSLSICKKYAAQYKRIKLLNQENKGLSAARNAGLRQARGRYVMFVDSDDFIHLDTCRILFSMIEQHSVDMVAFKFLKIDNRHFTSKPALYNENEKQYLNRVLDQRETLFCHFNDILYFFAWNKIFKKKLFIENQIEFPEGRLYEDSITNLKIYLNCKSVFIIDSYLYYYRYNRIDNISMNGCIVTRKICDKYYNYIAQIQCVLQQPDAVIRQEEKKEYANAMKEKLCLLYMDYQHMAIQSFVISSSEPENIQYYLFGASTVGGLQYSTLKLMTNTILFADNNKKKENTIFLGKKVISCETLKRIYNPENSRIFITSMYFLEIYRQLLEVGIVSSLEEIMPFRGETSIEKAYIDGLKELLAACLYP